MLFIILHVKYVIYEVPSTKHPIAYLHMLLLTFGKSAKKYFSSVFVSDICKRYSSERPLYRFLANFVIAWYPQRDGVSRNQNPPFSRCFSLRKTFCSKMWKIHQCLVGIWKCRSLMLRTAYLSMCSAVFTASSVKIHLLLPCLHNIHKQDASRTEILFNTVKYFKEKMHRYDSSCDHHICFDFSTAPVFSRSSFHFSAITLKLQWPSGYRTQPIPSDFPTRMFSSGESSAFLFHFFQLRSKHCLPTTFSFFFYHENTVRYLVELIHPSDKYQCNTSIISMLI